MSDTNAITPSNDEPEAFVAGPVPGQTRPIMGLICPCGGEYGRSGFCGVCGQFYEPDDMGDTGGNDTQEHSEPDLLVCCYCTEVFRLPEKLHEHLIRFEGYNERQATSEVASELSERARGMRVILNPDGSFKCKQLEDPELAQVRAKLLGKEAS